jgi:F420-non-reducing hydrogenase iron-sulfur subunit
MTAPAAPASEAPKKAHEPTILVFSTNNISDPGIDLAGSAHLHYNPGVRVMPLPCTSLIKPAWILHAIESGFDGVFIASDGDECAYLPDCAERASHNLGRAQQMLKDAGHSAQRVRMAAICSVCAEPFAAHMANFTKILTELS